MKFQIQYTKMPNAMAATASAPRMGGVMSRMPPMGTQMGDVMAAMPSSTGLNSSSVPPPSRTVGIATAPAATTRASGGRKGPRNTT